MECKVSGYDELNFVCLSDSMCTVIPAGCETDNKAKVDGIDCPNLLDSIPTEKIEF